MRPLIINHFHISGNYIAGDFIKIHDNPSASFYLGLSARRAVCNLSVKRSVFKKNDVKFAQVIFFSFFPFFAHIPLIIPLLHPQNSLSESLKRIKKRAHMYDFK